MTERERRDRHDPANAGSGSDAQQRVPDNPADQSHRQGDAGQGGPGPDRQKVRDTDEATNVRGQPPVEPAEGRRDIDEDREEEDRDSSERRRRG